MRKLTTHPVCGNEFYLYIQVYHNIMTYIHDYIYTLILKFLDFASSFSVMKSMQPMDAFILFRYTAYI